MSMSTSPPFFIVGSPRSGTTLVHTILASHSEVAIPPETYLFSRFAYKTSSLLAGRKIKDHAALHEMALRDLDLAPLHPFLGRGQMPEIVTFGDWVHSVMSRYAESLGKTRWGEKTPQHLWFWRKIYFHFPNAMFIVVERDGRDVVCSMSRVPWASQSMYANAHRWKKDIYIGRALRAELGDDRVHIVSYERLVQAPVETVQNLCAFLQLPYEAGMLETFGSNREVIRPEEWEWKKRNTEPIFSTSIGRYRKDLSKERTRLLTSLLAPELRELGIAILAGERAGLPKEIAVRLLAGSAFYFDFGKRWLRRISALFH